MPEELEKLREELKEKYESLKTDLEIDHAEGEEEQFTLPEEAQQDAAKLLESMLQSLTLTSPVTSVVSEITRKPDVLEIAMADDFAVIVKMPEKLMDSLDIMVTRGQKVEKGEGLIDFTEAQLEASAFFLVGTILVHSPEDELQHMVRVFGPFIPVPAE